MSQRIFLFFLFFILLNTTKNYAQTWEAIGQGTDGCVYSITKHNNNICIGGLFNSVGGQSAQNVAVWLGDHWEQVGSGISNSILLPGNYGSVRSLQTYNGELYAGGDFWSGSLNYLVKYNGTDWQVAGTTGFTNSAVYTMDTMRTMLLAGGRYSTLFGVNSDKVGCFNGNMWANIAGNPVFTTGSEIFCSIVYNNQWYIGGNFTNIGTEDIQYLARWNGANWESVGGNQVVSDAVYAMTIHGGKLVIGGDFMQVAGNTVNHIAAWDGISWEGIGQNTLNDRVMSLASYQNLLWIGTENINGTNQVYNYTGSNWESKNLNVDGIIYTMEIIDNNLYIGGCFTNANGTAANSIAKLSPVSFPVELVRFSGEARNCHISLNWETASEKNNSHFEIQKSKNGKEFRTIATVKGHLNSSQNHVYTFLDEDITYYENYYQLYQIDTDGTRHKISQAIYIDSPCYEGLKTNEIANVFPNPAEKELFVKLWVQNIGEETAELMVFDILGNKVSSKTVALTSGMSVFDLDIENLASSVYFIQLVGKDWKSAPQKWVKN